jgi:hypothetical protein
VGSSLNFSANAPASLTLNWDLHAFGTFGDGGGDSAEVTYRLPGERVISLRATGPGIVPVVATALVTIADDNAPPSFESALPDPAVQWIQSGQDLAFAVQTSDSDGDPVSVTWLLDGVEVASGEQWSTSFSEAEWGQHHVSAIASDGRRGHDVTHDFLVLVRGPDADGDGWSDTAQGDCDDADPGINPEAIERLLNGKDDDCDPATLDAPPATAGGNISGGQLVAWGIDLSSGPNDGTPTPVAGLGDAVQVEVGLAHAWALRGDGSVAYYTRTGGPCSVSGTGVSSCAAGISDVVGLSGAPKLRGVTFLDYDDYR